MRKAVGQHRGRILCGALGLPMLRWVDCGSAAISFDDQETDHTLAPELVGCCIHMPEKLATAFHPRGGAGASCFRPLALNAHYQVFGFEQRVRSGLALHNEPTTTALSSTQLANCVANRSWVSSTQRAALQQRSAGIRTSCDQGRIHITHEMFEKG